MSTSIHYYTYNLLRLFDEGNQHSYDVRSPEGVSESKKMSNLFLIANLHDLVSANKKDGRRKYKEDSYRDKYIACLKILYRCLQLFFEYVSLDNKGDGTCTGGGGRLSHCLLSFTFFQRSL